MSDPFRCIVWRVRLMPNMSDQVVVGEVLRAIDLLEAHSLEDLVGQNVVKILPDQQEHPLYEAAYRRWRSRLGGELEHMERMAERPTT